MRIGYDVTPVSARSSGVGTYARHLLIHMAELDEDHEFYLFSNRAAHQSQLPAHHAFHDLGRAFPNRMLWMQCVLPQTLKGLQPQICHYPNSIAPLRSPCPYVVTIHDMTLSMLPHYHPWRKQLLIRPLIPLVARRAARVITVSQSARNDIVRLLHIPAERVSVIPEAAAAYFRPASAEEQARVRAAYGLRRPFIFSIGTLEPRKNLVRLIRAWGKLRQQGAIEHQLVIAGGHGWQYGPIYAEAQRLDCADDVIFTGYLPASDLPGLYSAADVFAFPSLYEGFGLPVVEAMACGTPVLISTTPALVEVAGDAAVQVEAHSVASISEGLERILSDAPLREQLRQAGLARAASYSWERTARSTLAVYRQAVEVETVHLLPSIAHAPPSIAYRPSPTVHRPPATVHSHSPSVAETLLSWLAPDGASDLAAQTTSWGPGDWAAARWATQVHGVAPLLCAHLRGTAAWAALDPTLSAYLDEQHSLNTARTQLILADLAKILRAASATGLEVVPLKGAVLATHYYGESALRPLADLDLLVRPADEARIAAILGDLGYLPTINTERHRAYAHSTATSVVSTTGEHPDNPRGVELHSALHELFWGISYEMTAQAWERAALADFAGAPGLLLAPDVLIEHLLIHAATDLIACKGRLIRLYDLALVAPKVSAAGWQRLVAMAQSQGEERLLYAPLALAEHYLGPIAPTWAMDSLANGVPAQLRTYLRQTGLARLSLCNSAPARMSDKLSWFHPGREQIEAVRAMVCPSPRELRQRFPQLRGPFDVTRLYLDHGRRALVWPLRAALGLPRQAWLHRERGAHD